MEKATKRILLTLLVVTLINAAVFVPSASAVGTVKFPTVWVNVHRIQAVNVIGSDTEWSYNITVSDGEKVLTEKHVCRKTGNDVTVDCEESFTDIENQKVWIKIELYAINSLRTEIVDISSSSGTSFDCIYNLATNELSGDNTTIEEAYYRTSGDQQENCANLWFTIFDDYDAPVANAGADQAVYTGEVNFDGSHSTASEGSSIIKFEWDFEDDEIIDAEGKTATHTYNEKGTKTCRLTVTDSLGATSEDTCHVSILNRKPVAEFTFCPSDPTIQDEVNFMDNSSDSDGAVTSWFWDFGDETNSTTQNPVHVFSQKGEWQVTLTVTDNHGAATSTTQTVTVVNLPPAASFNCTTKNQTDLEIQFTDNSVDPENRTLSWLWDFGDGNTSELQAPTHKFATKGDYNVTLTVTDDENATSTYTMTVPVTDTPTADAFPLWIIAVIVIVVAATAFVGLLWRSRRHKTFPEMFVGSSDPMQ